MADVIKKATNKFTKGLIMDFSPENTQNEILTHALNATLLTFNGNELSLQNDMGNARVETAFLPEGYIPVGTCEYGGIIYIVSYNPLEDKSQIGCFPSPERNVSREELGISGSTCINNTDFQKVVNGNFTGDLSNTTKYVILRNDSLNPGDKFLISSNDSIYQEHLENLQVTKDGNTSLVEHPVIAINVVSIEDSGKIVYLNSDLRQYSKKIEEDTYTYHVLGEKQPNTTKVDIDSYRNVLSSGYNVFRSKTSGKLAILAELITIDSYSVTHSIQPRKDAEGEIIDGYFDVIIHTEVTPEVTPTNYLTVPKLKYYYLDKSQGYIQTGDGRIPLFTKPEGSSEYSVNDEFTSSELTTMYVPTVEGSIDFNVKLGDVGEFNFPKPETYHGNMNIVPLSEFDELSCYSKFEAGKYYRIHHSQIEDVDYYENFLHATFYNTQSQKEDDEIIYDTTTLNSSDDILYVSVPVDSYVPGNKFKPSLEYNYILGDDIESNILLADPLVIYKLSDFIPHPDENYTYNDVNLGHIKIPDVVSENGLDIPFKYDYTIIPCMNYGKLPHLAVSNTVDFSKLHDFNKSNFNIWKYRIDGNQLRLTFGTEVFDTYENDKVDAIILEFYDLWGFAGSLEITNKKSYTGTFTKILDLNALNSLSTKKISSVGGYNYNYARNINIQEAVPGNPDGGFKFGGKEIQFVGHDSGWIYADGSELGDNNDCGALYSNIIYGVKTYFRRTVKGEHEFIRKGDLFMFTLPIYNDYYYTIDNFNTLEYPQLEMFLTYKIIDNGIKIPLNSAGILGGYCPSDKEAVSTYVGGNHNISESTTLDLVKYYKYKGTSSVNLEVGLKQEYKDLNLGCDPSINSIFKCTIQLISDDSTERVYSVKVNDSLSTNYIKSLNYINSDKIPLDETINKIGFNSEFLSQKEINDDFTSLNFLTSSGNNTIDINYEFVVGYKINITNIRATQVPATTVCALFHQNDGNYNYEDFGIYKYESSGNDPLYLSKTAFYNGGDSKTVKFGLAKQVSIDPDSSLSSQFSIQSEFTNDAVLINDAGILNTKYLKNVCSEIGKLAFCNPHVHAIDDSTTSCISFQKVGVFATPLMGIYGNPHTKVKRFNLVASTESMFNQYSKFVSAVQGHLTYISVGGTTDQFAEFSSVNAPQLEVFNRKLLNTMSGVYAYNPDYDFIDTSAGDVSVQDDKLQFTSNLISSHSELNFPKEKTLNDYIYIGPMCVKSFFNYLSKYSGDLGCILTTNSEGNILPSIAFVPNYTFCGSSEAPYLISTLTYNIPTSDDIASDLNYTSSEAIIVKHSDSSQGSDLVVGTLNKKALYGFSHEYGKLVELDVSNYTINSKGKLSVISKQKAGTQTQDLQILSDHLNGTRVPKTYATFSGLGGSSKVDITVRYGVPQGELLASGSADDGYPSVFVAIRSQGNGRTPIIIHLEPAISENDNFSYEFIQKRAKIGARVTYLDPKKIGITNSVGNIAPLTKLSYNDLKNLMEGAYSNLPNASNTGAAFSPKYLSYFWHEDFTGNSDLIKIDGIAQGGNMGGSFEDPIPYTLNNSEFDVNVTNSVAASTDVILLYELKIPQMDFIIKRYIDIGTLSGEIIPLTASTKDTDPFDNARLRGTTITLNDLVYNPFSEHRLFIKDSRYTPSQEGIAYRGDSDRGVVDTVNDTKMFFGPSFLSYLDSNFHKELS